MSNWNSIIVTNKGKALHAKALAGECDMHFTKFKIGDGVLPAGQTAENLNDLISPKQIVPIIACTVKSNNYCEIDASVINSGLQTAYYMKEMGLFATDPDNGEIMYCYSSDEIPDLMPAMGTAVTISEDFAVNVAVDSHYTVTADVAPLWIVSQEQFDEIIRQTKETAEEAVIEIINPAATQAAQQAAASATQTATQKATEAANSAAAASTSKTQAANSAVQAANSATQAAESAADSESSAQTANQRAQECAAGVATATQKAELIMSQISTATQAATTATTKAQDASLSAANAAQSATNAANSATQAAESAAHLVIDNAVSLTSTNAVQNKVITEYIQGYIPRSAGNVITGDTLGQNVANKGFVIRGGFDNLGSYLVLTGKNFSTGGQWELVGTVSGNQHKLALNGSGALVFDNKSIVRSIDSIEADVNGNVNLGLDSKYLKLSGGNLTGNLTVNSKNVVRTVNNTNADTNGNVSITPATIGALALAGGEFNSNFYLGSNVNTTSLMLRSGNGYLNGAGIELYGIDCETNKKGTVQLLTADGTSNAPSLVLNPNGTMKFANKEVERVNEIGNNYIRYESGLQICNAQGTSSTSGTSNTLPKAFINTSYQVVGTHSGGTPVSFTVSSKTTTNFTVKTSGSNGDSFQYIAIGRWK